MLSKKAKPRSIRPGRITAGEVERIAKLARVDINEEEKNKYEKDLSAILDFVEKLNEVDTVGVEPLTGGTDLKNISRPDEWVNKDLEDMNEKILKQAPDTKDNWIKVKAVFG